MTQGGGSRKGKGGKSASRHAGKSIRTMVSLSAEAYQRLGVHAHMTGRTNSQVVEALILDHLRRFRVHDHGGQPLDPPPPAGQGG